MADTSPELDGFLWEASLRQGRRGALSYSVWLIFFASLLALAVYFFFFFFTFIPLCARLIEGYPRYGELFPGPYVSDRFSLSWFLLVFLAVGLVLVALSFMWILKGVLSHSKRALHATLALIFFALSIIGLAICIVSWLFFCNINSSWSLGICNDDRWCDAYAADHPSRCRTPSMPVDPATLTVNPQFIWYMAFLGFAILFYWFSLEENRSLARNIEHMLSRYSTLSSSSSDYATVSSNPQGVAARLLYAPDHVLSSVSRKLDRAGM